MLQDSSSEIELLRASLKGNTAAFGVIVRKYQSLLCAITFSATTDVEKSEELAHEALISAWANLAQLKDLTKFRAWLCSIARSLIRNYLRHQRRDIVGQAASISEMADISSQSDEPVEAIINKEQQAVITQALEQIPERYREALVLYYREQKSLKQVARLLELSDEAARTRVSRGRKLLKERVAAMVETTISQTGPGKAFTTAVIASVAGMAIKGSGITAAAGVAAAASATGTTAVIKTAISGLTGKIVAAAVVAAVGLGTVVLYRQVTRPAAGPEVPETVESIPPEQPTPPAEPDDNAEAAEEPAGRQEESVADAEQVDSVQVSQSEPASIPRGPVQAQEAEYRFQPKGVLSGLITDIETGEPVTDTTVRISMGRIYDTKTDSDGFYYFEKIKEPGNYDIAIDSKAHIGISWGQGNPMVHLMQAKQVVKHFQLSRACQIDLRVVDANGVGVKGAKVVATSLADENKKVVSNMGTTRETDENGQLLLGGFPPAETDYLITVWHEVTTTVRRPDGRLWGERDYDYAQARLTVKLTDPNVIEQAQIVLPKGVAVRGYAEYSDGIPADDLEIVARPSWWHCNSAVHGYDIEADGIFTLKHIAPGTYDICAYYPRSDFGGGAYKKVMQAQLPLADDELLVVRIPEQSPASLASIAGTIIYVGEKKPRYVYVDAYSPTARHARTSVGYGSDGEVKESFVLGRLQPGKYRLTFSGENIEQKIIENVEAPAEGIEVELLYSAKPRFEGTVVDSQTGEPLERFKVRAKKLRSLHGSGYLQQDQWAHFVDEQGRFGVEVVGPGIYQLQVAADGHAPTWSGQISTDEPESVVVELGPGGAIKGRVVDAEGQPITGAKVIPLSKAAGNTYQTQDKFCSEEGAVETVAGQFTLKNLPAGTESLKVVHPDYAFSVAQNIAVVEGETLDGVEIVLSKGAVVEGYVHDVEGKPEPGVTLYFQDAGVYGGSDSREESRLGTAITDSNGFYRVPRLPEKMCYVMRKDGWQSLGVIRRTVMPKNGQTVELDFGGAPVLTGAVVVDGLPLPQTRILLGSGEVPEFGSFVCYARTDAQGRFVFRGTIPGPYAIYYENPDKRSDWIKIMNIEVGQTNLDVGIIAADVSRLLVAVDQEGSEHGWQITQMYISEAGKVFGQPIRMANPPAAEGEPWVISNVEAGMYLLSIQRHDQVQIRREIELEPDQSEWSIALQMPEASAAVSGEIVGSSSSTFTLWNKNKDVVGNFTTAGGGVYEVKNLPAGTYSIGTVLSLLSNMPGLVEFDLLQGQSKVINLDVSHEAQQGLAYLMVQVFDENVRLRGDVRIWLEGSSLTIQPWRSAEQGHIFLTVPGEYILHVARQGYKDVARQIVLKRADPAVGKPETAVVHLDLE